MKSVPATMSDGPAKDGGIVQERLDFLIGKECRFRVWWTQEAQAASPGGDLFEGTLMAVVPVGRDYYFVLSTGSKENPKRSIIKTAAVIQISEL